MFLFLLKRKSWREMFINVEWVDILIEILFEKHASSVTKWRVRHTPLECQFYKETPRRHLKWKRIYKFIIFLVCLVIVALRRNLLQYIPRPICWLWCHIHINMIFFVFLDPKGNTEKREIAREENLVSSSYLFTLIGACYVFIKKR